MFAQIGEAIIMLFERATLLAIVGGSIYGLSIGAIPGLTATMAAALLVPFTFFMAPLPAMAAIISMSAMAIFAGDIPATLVRMPGTPSSAAYTEDSYRLTQRGLAGQALGVDVICSAIGGILGSIVLMLAAPILAEYAMRFTSFEYFWLAVLGLSSAVVVSSASLVKGGIALMLGLLFSTVGIDITLGFPRFTFGSVELTGGIDFIPAMIGLFGVSEVLRNVMRVETLRFATSEVPKRIFGGIGTIVSKYKAVIARSSAIGVAIGILPGAGADIAAWVSYAITRNTSGDREQFGKGHIEPILAGTSANNAALAGAWVPALVFGIPGDSITAILIGVLMMKGLRPGPMIFEQQPVLIYGIYAAFLLANLLLVPFGYLAIRSSGLLLRVPKNVLLPGILLFSIVGAFAINNSIFDVGIMLFMGVLGYILEANQVPVAPVVLGIVLGPIVEQNFMISVIKVQWNLWQFVTRPVSAVLCLAAVIMWTYPFLGYFFRRFQARRSISS
jgi:putative tricarboxylic transport membrane protein